MGLGNAISTAVSGLRANSLSVAVTANNVANVATPGFIPERLVTASVVSGRPASSGGTAGGGVTTSVQPSVPRAMASLDQSNVDLAGEFTRLVQAKAAYAQSLDVIRASDQMLKHRLDETA